MGKTGTYMYDEELRKMVKVSDSTPQLASRIDGVYFRQPYTEYFNGRNPVEITSKGQKKAEMERRGIAEYSDFFSDHQPDKRRIYSYKGMPIRKKQPVSTLAVPDHVKKAVQIKHAY